MKRIIIAEAIFDGRERRSGPIAVGVDASGRICSVGAADDSISTAEAVEIIRCPAGTMLLPGLVDLNVKLVRSGRPAHMGWKDEPVVDTVLRCSSELSKLLAEGCTRVRDLAASWKLNLQLRDAVARGKLAGPRIVAAGSPIAAVGRFSKSYPVLESRGADEARGHARTLLADGVDVITVAVTSGAATNGWQQMTEEEIVAIVQEAHRAGKRVASTCIGAQGAAAAVAAGVDSVDHGVDIDDRTLSTMAQKGIALVPTLRVLSRFASCPDDYGVPVPARSRMVELYSVATDTVRRALAAGVTIATGTDRHINESVADEVEELIAAGLSTTQALAAATHSASRVLDLQNQTGLIRQGADADLLLVRGDATRSPGVLRDVVWVMMGGELKYEAGQKQK